VALGKNIAGYSGLVPMDLTADGMKISAEEWAKWCADGRWLHCGHRVVQCGARK